jgi:hypothetical protein
MVVSLDDIVGMLRSPSSHTVKAANGDALALMCGRRTERYTVAAALASANIPVDGRAAVRTQPLRRASVR